MVGEPSPAFRDALELLRPQVNDVHELTQALRTERLSNERLQLALRLLHGAHSEVVFDTAEDSDLQRQVLDQVQELWHGNASNDFEVVSAWFAMMGAALAKEVDRLWPHEDDPAYRAGCLNEEAGEVHRAVTKRRHASHAANGLCKGLTVDQWTDEMRTELAQALGVICDIAHRERFRMVPAAEECLALLQQREMGT